MKHLPSFIISLLILSTFACSEKSTVSEFRNDTIVNSSFNYLPNVYVTDSDIFIIAAKLDRAASIYYSDTSDKINNYKNWSKNINNYLSTILKSRGLETNVCFEYITDRIIKDIKAYGTNCSACFGELNWLKFGMVLYEMINEGAIHNNPLENDSWLCFMNNYLPLLEYEVNNSTGSAGAYEVPITFSKVAQHRINYLAGL